MAPKQTGKKTAPKSKKIVKKTTTQKAKKGGKAKKAPKAKAPKKAKKVKSKKAKALKPKAELKSVTPKGAFLTKSELTNNFMVETSLSRKQTQGVFEALTNIGSNELNKRGKFVVPGMARFIVKKRAAKPARKGINPFTQEEMMFKAKPACKVVKAYVVKAFREL